VSGFERKARGMFLLNLHLEQSFVSWVTIRNSELINGTAWCPGGGPAMGRLRHPHPQREGLPNTQAVMAAGGGSPSARAREPAHGAWLGAYMMASFKRVCR